MANSRQSRDQHLQEPAGLHRAIVDLERDNVAATAAPPLPGGTEAHHLLVETMNDGLGVLDAQGQITYLNQRLAQILGYSPDELIGRPVVELVDDRERRAFQDRLAGRKKGDETPYELTMIQKDGRRISTQISPRRIVDAAGRYQGSFAIITDITKRKRAEEALQRAHHDLEATVQERTAELRAANNSLRGEIAERKQAERALRDSEERFRSLIHDVIDSAAVGIFILDSAFNVVWANRALGTFFDIRRDELIGKDKCQLIRQRIQHVFENPGHFAEKVLATYASNTYTERFECHVLPAEGRQERWLEHWSKPIRTGLYAGGRVEVYLDTTERKRAVQALRASEQRFRSTFENAGAGMARVNQDGRFIQVNRALSNLLAYDEEELLKLTVAQVTHPGDRDETLRRLDELKAGRRQVLDLEKRYSRKDGTTVWAHVTVSCVPGGDSKDRHYVALVQDITRRKQAEHALRDSEERFRQLAENIREVFWMTSPDFEELIYISPAYEMIWGRTRESLYEQPRSYIEAIHPDDRDVVVDAVTEQGELDLEYRIVRRDGSMRWIRDRAFPIRDETGQIYRVAGIAEDITARKQAEQRLAFQAQLLDSVRESVVATDLEGRVIYWSKGAEALYGYAAEEVMGQSITFIVEPPEEEEEVRRMRQVRETGSWTGQYLQRRKNGASFWADTFISLVTDDSGKPCGCIGIDRDISDRKQAEEALRESEERFRQIAENADEIFFLSDARDHSAIYINPAYEEVYGRPVEELYVNAKSWMEAVHPDDRERVSEVLEKHGRGRQAFSNDYRIVRPDGSIRWLHDRVFPVRNVSGEVYRVVGIGEDITERKQTED
ncbi:MAG: PAS domain-containing protein, partial [Planctomycetota bacterium]